MVAAAVVGSAVVSGVASQRAAKKQASAASDASAAQVEQSYAAMEQQQRQFEAQQAQFQQIQQLLSPYTHAGNEALLTQSRLLGLNGPDEQRYAMSAVENSPYFSDLVQQGENAILQNASATGGLRGGNTQAALAQFRPNMLAAAIDQQYQRLSGLSSLGQNAAAGVGNAGVGFANVGQSNANATSSLLGQIGAAQAGGILGQASGQVQGINGISSAFGTGLGGLAQYFNQPSYASGITGTAGGNAGAYSTGPTLNNNFAGGQSGAATYF